MGRLGIRHLAGIVLIAALAQAVPADDTGTTVTRIDYNAETDRLEMAIRARPKQVEEALSAYFGAPVSFLRTAGDEPEVEALLERRLARYVRDTVFIESVAPSLDDELDETTEGAAWTASWVGFEVESPRRVWLYVEFAPPRDHTTPPTALRISQRMFFETGAPQSNTVRLKVGGIQKAFNFTAQVPVRILQLEIEPAAP